MKWLLKATRQWVQEAEALGTELGPRDRGKRGPLQVAFKSDVLL